MTSSVLSCVELDIKAKDGKPASKLYEVYVKTSDGKIGSMYSGAKFADGDVVELFTSVKDGRVVLKIKSAQ